ncbi:MAG TPA: carbamoyltransferase C-terminal domain-containing protein [Gammaproteobacteria bacterium]|nr:carbamoyltransferase C-terminal domain-containing protein [Gammaproteobacteria bacterium]
MLTLGINAAYHDSAACLVQDGQLVAAAEEERFTRIKHGKRPVPFSTWELPYHAIDFCLARAGIDLSALDHVAYSYDPSLLLRTQDDRISLPLEPSAHAKAGPAPWEPLFLAYIVNAERQLVDGAPHHLRARFSTAKTAGHWRWHFVEHHLSHEASAFLASPFDATAVLTIDGRGERTATSYGHYADGKYRRLAQVPLPHSLGLLYEEVTAHLGFLRSSDEYKVMALASYGRPAYADLFRDIVRADTDGRYQVRAPRLAERFGPARRPGAELAREHFDIARSLQLVLEDTVLELARWLRRETGAENLCMAGGVALNCVLNSRLRDAGVFRRVWIQPAAGDAGTALGAALWIDWNERAHERRYRMEHVYLGSDFREAEIEAVLDRAKLPYRRLDEVAEETAELLARNRIVGWFQGRMEFGPRALGARSILASPLDSAMQQRLNDIKDREDFRPVAPVVLEEEAANWFAKAQASPFMLFVFDLEEDKAARIPAVRHVDGTARVQTIRREQHPLYYDLVKAFQRRTGVPVLVNTSFNTRGQPIVCTPRDAVECFYTSPLDALVMGPFLLEKPAT